MAVVLRDPTFGLHQGRYELGDLIATGGMGSVYRAFDRLGQRQVAYKRLRVNIEAHRARATALFRREYDTLARLEHPNIVSVHEFGVDGHGPFYTMELVSGDDLAKRGRMPVREACRIARDVASALALVHARRLIHRDVSPNNVRLTATDDAKLIDFGALTAFGTPPELVGTPQFVAPECLTQEPLDQRVDLYSLGAITYFMLTRQLAVRATSLESLPTAWEQPIPPPSTMVPEIPAALDDLVLQLLRPDRDARPATAGEVVERLTNIASLPPEHDERRVAFSYLKHPPLQGRSALLDDVSSALDALMQGRGGVLRIEGSAGSGRSALLEQVGIEAQLRGATVLRADGSMHSTPLAAALHLSRTGLAVHPDLATQFRERHSSLVVETPRAPDPTELAERQARVAGSVQETLLSLGLRSPLVLLIDDADRIDAASLGLLASMVERIGRHPILIALTRVAAPPASDAEALLRASGTLLSLTPLGERDVLDLVRTMFGGVPNSRSLARWLFVESGGNPRHCIGLVGWLLNHAAVRYDRGTFTLPTTIDTQAGLANEEALRLDQLARTGEGPIRIVHLLALAETPLDVVQLAEASGRTTAQVLDDLRALDDVRLVLTSEGSYAPVSRTFARVVEAQLTPAQRRPLHLALARAVGTRPEVLVQVSACMHLVRAGGDDALEGALRIAKIAHEHQYELLMSSDGRRGLESALAVLEKHGYTDLDCAHMLTVLGASGFWGDLDAQRRYFDRAVRAQYTLTGLGIAVRLRPFLGAGISLVLGIVLGGCLKFFRPARLPRRTLRAALVDLLLMVGAAVAAAACSIDTPEAQRVASYLDPLAPVPENTAVQLARRFCLAVVDTSDNRLGSAYAAYRRTLEVLKGPVSQLEAQQRQQLFEGSLHGIAESTIEDRPAEALDAADKLAQTTFFAPHAELVRMYHHGWRGERALAEEHRARAEALALLGAVSWSAVVLINVRAFAVALICDDMLEVVRLNAEFERMAHLSPALAAVHTISQADVLRMRGRPTEAIPLYEAALNTEAGQRQPVYRSNIAWYARALTDAGRALEAKQLCTRVLAQGDDPELPLATQSYLVEQQLAVAECRLGEHPAAARRLDAMLARFAANESPLLQGSLHRERAVVALAANDAAAFDLHFHEMQRQFAQTKNPWLIQQSAALLTRAVRAGLRPAIPARTLLAIEESSADLDGATALELRETEASPADTELDVRAPDEKPSRTG
ncbi:MAG: protein kinase [Polyangiales bacterium]